MGFITHRVNPFHKQEEELKKARDLEIRRLRNENKSDEEIIGCLMCMPETQKFIEDAVKLNPMPGGQSFMRAQLTLKLKDGFTTVVKRK